MALALPIYIKSAQKVVAASKKSMDQFKPDIVSAVVAPAFAGWASEREVLVVISPSSPSVPNIGDS